MADRVSVGLRSIGVIALMACLFVVVAIGLHWPAPDDSPSDSSDVKSVSFDDAVEVGEIEGRRIYKLTIDGVECVVLSGLRSGGISCNWSN